jgi:mRNA interferase MazF
MASPKRGEIWWVDLEPAKGDEINKTRPAIVLSELARP